jgi:hypothetical protein
LTAVTLSTADYPEGWAVDRDGLLYPNRAGTVETELTVDRPGTYQLSLGGSFRDRMRVDVDGRTVADLRYRLNDSGDYTRLGDVILTPGRHTVRLQVSGPDLHPGSGGYPYGMGPLVLSSTTAEDEAVTFVDPASARSLCGKRLDWVEAIGSASTSS